MPLRKAGYMMVSLQAPHTMWFPVLLAACAVLFTAGKSAPPKRRTTRWLVDEIVETFECLAQHCCPERAVFVHEFAALCFEDDAGMHTFVHPGSRACHLAYFWNNVRT